MQMSRGLYKKVLFIFSVCLRHSPPPRPAAPIPHGYTRTPEGSAPDEKKPGSGSKRPAPGKFAKNLEKLLYLLLTSKYKYDIMIA